MKLFLLLFVLLFIEIECIFDRQNANAGQFPYQVSIRNRKKSNIHIAGGAIIGQRFILTSARPIKSENLQHGDILVVAGSLHIHIPRNGTEINIDKILVHHSYSDETIPHNIALLHTAKEIQYTSTIQPVELASQNLPIKPIIKLTVSGWGNRNKNVDEETPITFGTYESIDIQCCKSALKEASKKMKIVPAIDETQICTYNPKNTGVCFGDEGSPLVNIHGHIVGVLSWFYVADDSVDMINLCGTGYPNVYTRVYKYRDWILTGDGHTTKKSTVLLISITVAMIFMNLF